MDLTRSLMLFGGVATLLVWFVVPAQFRNEWPVTTLAVTFGLAMLPSRLAAAPTFRGDCRTHWALRLIAIPFALMFDASVTQGALHPMTWILVFGCIMFVVWYALPALRDRSHHP